MFDRLKSLLWQHRQATDGVEREKIYESLCGEVARLLKSLLRIHRAPDDLVDDLSQEKVLLTASGLIERGVSEPAAPAYLRSVVRNSLRAHYKLKHVRVEQATAPEVFGLGRLAERLWEQRASRKSLDEDEEHGELVDLTLRVLRDPDTPVRHRELLEVHYLEGIPIDELAERLLADKPVGRDGQPRSLTTVRNLVDQRLHRARTWLRVAVLESLRNEED
jgi:DNA-directed RNA polymerase specialized sigma24 family protein